MSYQDTWIKPYSLGEFNVKSHDGVMTPEELKARAEGYCKAMFPPGFFGAEDIVLDFGCGVGYIIEELLSRCQVKKIVGLDISEATLELAQKRLSHPALSWQRYDGRTIPFEDHVFDKVYSTACIQHIEEHAAFLLLAEIMRVLKPKGKAALHFITWKRAPHIGYGDYSKVCEMICKGEECHWHVFYTREELEIKFVQLLGAEQVRFKDLDSFGGDVIAYVTKSGESGQKPAPTSLWRLPGRAWNTLWYQGGEALTRQVRGYLTWLRHR